MPICPRCNVAYLDSETHVCSGRHRTIWTTIVVIAAPVVGSVVATIAVIFGVCPKGESLCGLFGPFIAFPVGAISGGVVSYIVYRRSQ
jgi:hypothetical protein